MIFLCLLCLFAAKTAFNLEVEPCLKLHYPSRQRTLRPTKVTTIDCRMEELKRSEIQIVEGIKEICLDFKKRTLTKRRRHTKALAEAHIDRKKSWTTERVTTDARRQK